MTSCELTEETRSSLQQIIDDYIWNRASNAELAVLNADTIDPHQRTAYNPPQTHTARNTEYLKLLVHIFMLSGDLTSCIEAARLRGLMLDMTKKPAMATDLDDDFQLVLESKVEEDDGDECKTPGLSGRFGAVSFTYPTERKEGHEARRRKPRSTLADALVWYCRKTENVPGDHDLLQFVYEEDELHIDRAQFTPEQREFLVRAFEGYRLMCLSLNDSRAAQLCEVEVIRLSKDIARVPSSQPTQPTPVGAQAEPESPVDAIVMKPPPCFRTAPQWCRDFVELARATMPLPSLEPVSTARAKLEADIKRRLPDRVRNTVHTDDLVRLMCDKYSVAHLRRVLSLMQDM